MNPSTSPLAFTIRTKYVFYEISPSYFFGVHLSFYVQNSAGVVVALVILFLLFDRSIDSPSLFAFMIDT